ncbi:rabenosyn-5-like [Lineus longissimus]|uniref:rabenosyn-5-like n=1 Tax=Lineus longissimus TaxID=88925 RepID=UPI002B4D543A
MSDVVIREGFLCPICMKDLGTVAQLQQHFEEAHSTEDKAVLQQLKDLFGKAKKKILGLDEEEEQFGAYGGEVAKSLPIRQRSVDAGGIDPTLWEPQELGAIKSHTDVFKHIRDSRIDRFVVETNKLLIRLDKLLSSDAPSEERKRRVYEQKIVPWAPDADVNLCPTCGKAFTLTRRRHHCRLCGGIMCNKCSEFLPFTFAKKLTNPAFQFESEGVGFLRRSGSNSSLNSMVNPEGDPHIRTCWDCRALLERRDKQVESRNTRPVIMDLYDKLKMCTCEADFSLPDFKKMADSLNAGENAYSLQEATNTRNKLIKLYDNIDLISKRIQGLGMNHEEQPHPKVVQLQKFIRIYASHYLHDNMLTLQSLPGEVELQKLQDEREREVQRKIAIERQAAIEAREKDARDKDGREKRRQNSLTPDQTRTILDQDASSVVRDSGWIPADVNQRAHSNSDPMVQQMNIIREYIKQARKANKLDEVKMLEENLQDLQKEYYKQMGHGFSSQNTS